MSLLPFSDVASDLSKADQVAVFVTDGIESALEQAFSAANGKDVLLGGGNSTVQQYLRAGPKLWAPAAERVRA